MGICRGVGECHFSDSPVGFLSGPLLDMGQGAQNSLPLGMALIPGVFAKVRKTPPPNFAHLDEAGSRCAELPLLNFAHLVQYRDRFKWRR